MYVSSLMYGSESWVLLQRTRSKIVKKVCDMSLLRAVDGVSRTDRMRSDKIENRLNIKKSIAHRIEERQMSWFGHLL